jgi:hypothetical protein
MTKAIVQLSYQTLVFDLEPGQTAAELAGSYGITDPALYAEFAESDFDAACYLYVNCFTLSGGVVSFSLPSAKELASEKVKTQTATEQQAALAGYTPEVLASQAILPELSRTPEIQVVLEAVNDLNTTLQANLAAIDAATTIDEVNNVVNPPTGILFTGRGSGAGAQDLNPSYYTEFNSASMTESETELYVPGTSTVIPYDNSFPPYEFDSAGSCFAVGDYLIQIRETATGRVIAEFEVPLAPANVDVAF